MRYVNRKHVYRKLQIKEHRHEQSECCSNTSATQHKISSSAAENSWIYEYPYKTTSSIHEVHLKYTPKILVCNCSDLEDNEHCKYNDDKGYYSLPNKWILLILFITFCFTKTTCQDCEFPPMTVFNVVETDPAGTEIFNVPSYNRTHVYRYTTNLGWLTAFLSLSFNESDLSYYMRLVEPLDLEKIYYDLKVSDVFAFPFILYCKTLSEKNMEYFIIVQPISESSPEFNTSSIQISVKETLPIKSVVVNLTNWASDRDINPINNEIAGYSFLPYTGDPQINGQIWLQMLIVSDGVIVIKQELDYETLPEDEKFILLGVQVVDQEGKRGSSSVTVFIEDDDDLPPVFIYPGCQLPCPVTYTVTVSPNMTGLVIGIKPAPIEATDGDTLNYTIEYHILKGPEHYEQFISMNSTNGYLTILQEIQTSGLKTLVLVIEAREISLHARSTVTSLVVTVEDNTKEGMVTSTSSNNDTTVVIVATILAIIILTAVVLLVIMMMYFKKRYRKTVHPENSLSKLQVDGSDLLHGIVNQTPSKLTEKETISEVTLQRTGLAETLSSVEPIDLFVALPRFPSSHETSHELNDQHNNEFNSGDSNDVSNGQNLDQVTDERDKAMEYLVSTANNTHDMAFIAPLKMGMEKLNVISDEKGTKRPNVPPRTSLRVLSGLKFQDELEDGKAQYTTLGKTDETLTVSNDPSGADQSTLNSTPIAENNPTFKQAKIRKKRPRKRTKTPHNLDEPFYDKTEHTENVEFDSGFGTGSIKAQIKRSPRVPVMIPDPSDTRYWITVTDDY